MSNQDAGTSSNILLQLVLKDEEINALHHALEAKDREVEALAKQLASAYTELTKVREGYSKMREMANHFQDASQATMFAVKELFANLTEPGSGFEELPKEKKSSILIPISRFIDEYQKTQKPVGEALQHAIDRG